MNTRARGEWPDGSPVVPAGTGPDLFDRIVASLGEDHVVAQRLGVVELLDRYRAHQRWEDFLEELHAAIGWPAIVWYDRELYRLVVVIDGRVVAGMDDWERIGSPRMTGVLLGMRVRAAWWPPEPA